MKFPLGTILSVTHDKLLCEVGSVYKILNYMTGDNLYTHQLPRACRVCAPHILRQHPQLASVDVLWVTPDNWRIALENLEKVFGSELDIAPLPIGDWTKTP